MRDWKPGPPRPPSSQPWSVDARDPLMVLDRDGQIVAVTTSRSDADWIVRCVNAVASLPADALDRTVLDEAIHVLREPSRFHSDADYRRRVEADGAVGTLQDRAGRTVIRIFGSEKEADDANPPRPRS